MDFLEKLITKEHYLNTFTASRFATKVSLTEVVPIINAVIESIKNQSFKFTPPLTYIRKFPSKFKLFFKYDIKDYLVLKIMADILNEYFLLNCSPYLYSYIKNRSHHQIIKNFIPYIQKNSELWVIKADIANNFATIPTDEHSKLWIKIDEILPYTGSSEFENLDYFKRLIYEAIRPIYFSPNGELIRKVIGIPPGCPLSNVLSNLYHSSLDEVLSCSKLFYARYSDDMLIASSDLELIKEKERILLSAIDELRQKINFIKYRRYYYTKSGRAKELDSSFQGTNRISFVRYIIHAHGKYQPSTRQTKFFLNQCYFIIHQASKNQQNLIQEKLGKYICNQLKENLLHIDKESTSEMANNVNCFLRINDYAFIKEMDKK